MGVALLIAAVAGGALLTRLYDEEASLAARLAAGAPLGMALVGLLGFLYASVLGLTSLSVALAVLSLVVPAWVLAAGLRRGRALGDGSAPPGKLATTGVVLFLLAALLLGRVFDRAMFADERGIHTGVEHNLGDLPFHLAIVTGFAKGENFPPEHPELAGTRLTYPFLVDFMAAQLVRAGASLEGAFFAQSLVLGLALVALLHGWALRATGDRLAALLTPALVLFSGGLGFVYLMKTPPADGLLALLARLPQDYTITRTGELRWGNALTTLLVPQRALLLGLPLAVLVWTLWWEAVAGDGDERRARRLMLTAGGVTGLLPLVHAHSFAVLGGVALCLALVFPRRRAWGAYFAAALPVALPQVVWLAVGSAVRGGSFVSWHLGWDRGERNPVLFWLLNAGLFLPLLVVALGRRKPRRLVLFCLPFQLCFLVPNLWKLSPWIWDNIKFLVYWYVASVPLVAFLLASLWRRGRWAKAGSALLLLSLTLSGGLDVWRVVSGQIDLMIFDADGVAFARRALEATPPRALILHTPTYESPVFLSGRRSLLGYPGHIWSQGLASGEREAEIRRIYEGAPDAAALLARHGVDYVMVGPQERSWCDVNEAFLEGYRLVGETGRYRLHAVR